MTNGKDAQGEPVPIASLAGGGTVVKVRERIADMLGVMVKEELGRVRGLRLILGSTDWAQYDS